MTIKRELVEEFERYEGGSQSAEEALIEGLVAKIGHLQHINRDPQSGKLHRGTHAKGLTCEHAKFEVLDVAAANPGAPSDVLARLRQGLYREPGQYPARARFANGGSQQKDDRGPDERAMSFSVDLGQGSRQDFSMNSASIFPIPSLGAFNFVFMMSLLKGRHAGKASEEAKAYISARLKSAISLRTLGRLPEVISTIRHAKKVTHREVRSFRQTAYWSGTAFAHGDKDAIKYLAVPCEGESLGEPPAGAGVDYLQQDLRDWVNTQGRPVSYDFRLQFLDAGKMRLGAKQFPVWKWVEDPTLDWDAAGARDWLVGRLTIPAGSISDDCDDPAVFPAFDVSGNALPEHWPLGRINRGRAVVETESRKNRA